MYVTYPFEGLQPVYRNDQEQLVTRASGKFFLENSKLILGIRDRAFLHTAGLVKTLMIDGCAGMQGPRWPVGGDATVRLLGL